MAGEVAAAAGVAGSHGVAGVKHLLGELGHGQRAVLLAALGRERREAGHEEVQAREGHHVHGQLTQVSIELAREAQRGSDAAHGEGHQVVEVPVGGRAEPQRAEADVVERLVVDAERLVTQLYPTLCDPMDCSMPGFPVHYQLPESTQTNVH